MALIRSRMFFQLTFLLGFPILNQSDQVELLAQFRNPSTPDAVCYVERWGCKRRCRLLEISFSSVSLTDMHASRFTQ